MSNEDFIRRIEAVDPAHAESMKQNPTTFETHAVPFYKRFKVLKALIRLQHKPVALAFADSGQELLPLNSEDDVYKVNGLEGLKLDANTAGPYVRMVLELTARKLQLAERADQVRWLPSTETDPKQRAAKDEAAKKLHPVRAMDGGGGSYAVSFTAVRSDRALVELEWTVAPDGRVTRGEEKVLVQTLPVPYVM